MTSIRSLRWLLTLTSDAVVSGWYRVLSFLLLRTGGRFVPLIAPLCGLMPNAARRRRHQPISPSRRIARSLKEVVQDLELARGYSVIILAPAGASRHQPKSSRDSLISDPHVGTVRDITLSRRPDACLRGGSLISVRCAISQQGTRLNPGRRRMPPSGTRDFMKMLHAVECARSQAISRRQPVSRGWARRAA